MSDGKDAVREIFKRLNEKLNKKKKIKKLIINNNKLWEKE